MNKKGFTLAEVLITLGIIGIVAAMTMPALIQKNNERQAVAQLKKFYSTLSQAYILTESELGSPDNWQTDGYATRSGALQLLQTLSKQLKIKRICDKKRNCFPNVQYKTLNPKVLTDNFNQYAGSAEAILNDGTLIRTFIWDNNCNGDSYGPTKALQSVCSHIGVDINGYKKPNQYGVDYFLFLITKHGVIPNGVPEQTSHNSFTNSCKDKDRGANDWSPNGGGCAAWVIYNENMDYLHCKDLDWKTKTKCSK